MWPLKVILVCACWAGISTQPHDPQQSRLTRRDADQRSLGALAQSQNNILNMLQDTKSILEDLRQDFVEYKDEKELSQETIKNLLQHADVRDETIQKLTAEVQEKVTAMEEKDARVQRLEEENQAIRSTVNQMEEDLAQVENQLHTLKRVTQWDCAQLLLQGYTENGVYSIYPRNSNKSVAVWCDMKTDGGGWTVFLNRVQQPQQLNFSEPWQAYADGFGDPSAEYWLGNKHLHAITKNGPYTLRIDAQNLEGEKRFGKWLQFSIGDENSMFKIKVSDYSTESTLGDVLTEVDQNGEKYNPNGMKFSTMDQDNDRREGKSCSKSFGYGGWWYNNCYRLNPTAPLGNRNGDNTKARLYYWGPDMYTVQGIQALQLKIRKD
ncbi:fibrinogen-like protein 1 [Penaeus japonicus]|uniref:fibrinogen-like protein 1 n=1 Tax=Penaeus japonicus TaxID=27405 RepID=UPI001C70E167|nr:fibrinogen-like protein 1 [Penaeus japonicus]